MTTPPAPTHAHPQGRWQGEAGRWALQLAGDWRGSGVALPEPPPALLLEAHEGQSTRLSIDGQTLGSWDTRLASALWQRLSPLMRPALVLDLQGLPAGLRQILNLALPGEAPATPAAGTSSADASSTSTTSTPPRTRPLQRALRGVGQQARASAARSATTLSFVGDVLLALLRLLRGRTAMRASDLVWQIEQTGPRSLPIVALVSFLVGLIVAYMGAEQLVQFGAQTYIADLVTVGVMREIAALLVGIVLSGRVGAAFAAQLGSMRANEEIDALQTMGIDPIEHLVLPRVLALTLMGPLLTVFAALVGMAVGWGVAVLIFGVTPLEYVLKSAQALTLPHVLIGLLKGTVYALLVALAGCRPGLAGGPRAPARGAARPAPVVGQCGVTQRRGRRNGGR
ncbi:MAG: ABC transporter permease, partial [Rubrivivax sp.]|nr:ABC transporter permease [Rubrivivax sp.]